MAQVMDPYTIEFKEGCCVGSECVPIVLTLRTKLPVTRKALRAFRKGIAGKLIRCSYQTNCPDCRNRGCLLNIKNYYWSTEGSIIVTFSQMKPEALEDLIKADGYKIVNKKGFLASVSACGLPWGAVCRIIELYCPKDGNCKSICSKKKNPSKSRVSQKSLERFINANGYEIIKTEGICAAARTSGLSRHVVK